MRKDKMMEESALRANLSTSQESQLKENLFGMAKPEPNQHLNQQYNAKAPVNESHVNMMQAWQNLRGMDSELLQKNTMDGV
ncbi:hypothetical protein ACMA1I_15435 [Pontibacter sp. 13R65]|uniref:hypothetical protein n=1 Tax=Pontibacter sp. 13R65 TaxID=3127458 RepID=UPI00301CC5FB